jgi:hypothetical protein
VNSPRCSADCSASWRGASARCGPEPPGPFFRKFRQATLKQGTSTVTFTADELPGFDGVTRNPYGQRSAYAPVVDRVTVTPLA